MKKKIIVPLLILLVLVVSLGGITLFTNIVSGYFEKSEDYDSALKVFEIKYSIHKNPKTLDNIINVLGEISNYANGDDIEYHQKMAHYCKLWIESPENADRGGWYENMVKIYLSSLIELRDNATFQTEFEKALNNSVAPETNRLAFILRWYAQDADEQGLKWAKETTEKMFNEGYIVSDSQQEYDDMRSVYEDIINL